MAKYEFKVGDRVQFKEWDEMVKEFGKDVSGYGINLSVPSPFFSEGMKHLCGTYATLKNFTIDGRVQLSDMTVKDYKRWSYHVDMLKPASTKKQKVYKKHKTVVTPYEPYTPNKTIVSHEIEGNKTIVTLSDGSVGVSRCRPEDKFDAHTGLKLATERAYGITEAEEPQVKEVKREAKQGEYIKLTCNYYSFNEIGDILKVDSVFEKTASVYAKNHPLRYKFTLFAHGENHLWNYLSYDYVVLENYRPQKADEKHDTSTKAVSHKLDTQTKFEIGKRYILNNIAYKGTILEITSIVRITNAPHRPIIRYGVKIIHMAHDFRPIDFFEEGSRLAIALKPFEGEYVKEDKGLSDSSTTGIAHSCYNCIYSHMYIYGTAGTYPLCKHCVDFSKWEWNGVTYNKKEF